MPIEIQQPGLAGLYGRAAQISKAEKEAQRKQEQQARKEEQQAEFEYKTALRQQDMAIDLEMNQRAKLWAIEKMELRSRMDFQREEQQRQRKLDSIDSALQQIDKEVLAGRMTEQEAYPIKQKFELNKLGVDVPVSAFPGDEEERFGVPPYWMRGRDAPEGTPERQLYEAKMAEQISGERKGTVPYYLDPEWLRENRDIAQRVLERHEIMLEEDEIDAFIERAESRLPLADKELDIGVRAEGAVSGLPTVTSDAEYDALPSGTEFVDQSGKRWRKP